MMMKSLALALATVSVASAQLRGESLLKMREEMSSNPDYQLAKDLGIDPEAEFDLMVKHGVRPENGVIQPHKYHGEAKLMEIEEGSDREAALFNLCQSVEGLFPQRTTCSCVPSLALGLVTFECNTNFPVSRLKFEYSPKYFSVFTFRLFAMTYQFEAGVCADSLNYNNPSLNLPINPLNLGNFCLTFQYNIAYTQTDGIASAVTKCELALGFYATCNICNPCVTSDGNPGITLSCTTQVGGGDLPCIPLSIPFKVGERADPTGLLGGLAQEGLFQAAVDNAIEEAKLLATEEPQDEPADEPQDEPVEEPVEEPQQTGGRYHRPGRDNDSGIPVENTNPDLTNNGGAWDTIKGWFN